MITAARHRIMTIEDFLSWEARQDLRYEFDGFEPQAMNGGSIRHAAIQRNLAIFIGARLRGTGCAFYGSDLKLLTASQSRYPDGQVLCGPLDEAATFATNPAVIFEVVNPGSERIDRVDKVEEFCRIASVQAYVILEQDQPAATVLERRGQEWSTRRLNATDTLVLRDIGLDVPLAELYDGIGFSAPSAYPATFALK